MSAFAEEPDQPLRPSGPVLLVPPPQPKVSRWERWIQRIGLVIFVLFCLEVGIVLAVLPWTSIWTTNSLLTGFPQIRDFLNLGFVRGVISGLGLVDIWMGIAEAVRYRETADS